MLSFVFAAERGVLLGWASHTLHLPPGALELPYVDADKGGVQSLGWLAQLL